MKSHKLVLLLSVVFVLGMAANYFLDVGYIARTYIPFLTSQTALASEAADCHPAHECGNICLKGKACGDGCINSLFKCGQGAWVPGQSCNASDVCTGQAALDACEELTGGSAGDGGTPGDGGAVASDGGSATTGDIDFTWARLSTSWWEGTSAQANWNEQADRWHTNGAWVWCEDAKYCAESVIPTLMANPKWERIWLNLYGHQLNCSQYISSSYPRAWSTDNCELWIKWGRDTDGTGPDLGVTPIDSSHVYGSGKGWLDTNPATGQPYARVLDACIAAGRCAVMEMDDIDGFSGSYDPDVSDLDDLAGRIKAIFPGIEVMVRKQFCEIDGASSFGKAQHLDSFTAMFYASDLGGSLSTIDQWIAKEQACATAHGLDLIFNLAPITGGADGPVLDGSYKAMTAAEILKYGVPMCQANPIEVSLYWLDAKGTTRYNYLLNADVDAALKQVAAACGR